MRRTLGYLLIGVLSLPLLGIATFLHYYLPSTRKVHIVATEVKRMDQRDRDGAPGGSRDVRFIITRDADDGDTHMYRNEDTRWGWPPYFKFNSGDLAGDAVNIKDTQPNSTVLVTYYGWRVQIFDLYPNVVDLEIVDPRYTHVPVFNLFFFALLLGGSTFGFVRARGSWRRFRERRRAASEAKDAASTPDANPPDAGAA